NASANTLVWARHGHHGRTAGDRKTAPPIFCALTTVSPVDTIDDGMNQKHRRVLEAIFDEPIRSNIPWRDIEAMLKAAGAEVSEGEGSRVRIALNGVRAV